MIHLRFNAIYGPYVKKGMTSEERTCAQLGDRKLARKKTTYILDLANFFLL